MHNYVLERLASANCYRWGDNEKLPTDGSRCPLPMQKPLPIPVLWRKEKDPCPVGYRIPTIHEFSEIIKSNKISSKDVYGSILNIGDRLEFVYTYTLSFIWTTTNLNDDTAVAVSFFTADYGSRGDFEIRSYDTLSKGYGAFVRCTKKHPSEK